MDFETSTEKTPDGHTLVKNKHTNEPIAILKNAGLYKKNAVTAEWHPDFKLIHPEIEENLLHRNISPRQNKTLESAASAKDYITSLADSVARGHVEPDPVKSTYAGSEDVNTDYGMKKNHHYNIHDDEGNHIGKFISRHGPNEITPSHSDVHAELDKNYLDHHNISQGVLDAAKKKYPSNDLGTSMNRVRYILDNKNKEPRFVGTETATAPKTEIYKHKMDPSAASSAYEDALKKNAEKSSGGGEQVKSIITRHSPTAFTMHIPHGGSVYSKGQTHTVMSLPGEIHHTYYETSHPDYDGKKANPNVIESV